MPPTSTSEALITFRIGRGTYSIVTSAKSAVAANGLAVALPCGCQASPADHGPPSTRHPRSDTPSASSDPARPVSFPGDSAAASAVIDATSSSGTSTTSSMPSTRSRTAFSSTATRRPARVPPLARTTRTVATVPG